MRTTTVRAPAPAPATTSTPRSRTRTNRRPAARPAPALDWPAYTVSVGVTREFRARLRAGDDAACADLLRRHVALTRRRLRGRTAAPTDELKRYRERLLKELARAPVGCGEGLADELDAIERELLWRTGSATGTGGAVYDDLLRAVLADDPSLGVVVATRRAAALLLGVTPDGVVDDEDALEHEYWRIQKAISRARRNASDPAQ